jgi:hypothetical protein
MQFSCGEDDKDDASAAPEMYNFSLTGSDYTMHDGQTFSWRLYNRDTRTSVKSGNFDLQGDDIEVSVEKSLQKDSRYALQMFADMDGNDKCDAPPTDHAWTFPIDKVSGDVSLNQDHLMILEDICSFFGEGAEEEVEEFSITGQLKLESGIAIDSINPEGVEGAQIFAAGYPGQEAFTDSTGSFTLKLRLPASSELVPQSINLLMWFTERDADAEGVWNVPGKRVGAARALELNSDLVVGEVAMSYTKGLRIPVVGVDEAGPVDDCWVRIEGLGSQTYGLYNKEREAYEISYLPPGQYRVLITCNGYKTFSEIYTVGEATGFMQWEQQDAITLEVSD